MNGFETLTWQVEDGIGLLTLNRPERRNALDLAMRRDLAALLRDVKGDATVKAVVLTGAGGAFCAGGDLVALQAARSQGAEAIRARIQDVHTWFPDLLNLEKPVIGAVDGPAFGGGFVLALACDMILATPRARFCCVFPRIGMVPDLGAFWLLPRIMGLARAKTIALTGRTVGAEEGRSLGFVQAIHPPESLLDEAMRLARRFRRAPVAAIGMTKSALHQTFQLDAGTLAELGAYAEAMAHADGEATATLAFDWDHMTREEDVAP